MFGKDYKLGEGLGFCFFFFFGIEISYQIRMLIQHLFPADYALNTGI